MLRRLSLRDFVIVAELEIEPGAGFCVLTGETGAGKSILIDALQLALGQRAEATLVREGAARAEVSAEFDTPPTLEPWLVEGGFSHEGTLLLRRSVDPQGRSRAWINGSAATAAQLREAAEHLVEIHGQHAWQSLTRPAAVRELLDALAGAATRALADAWQAWRDAIERLDAARAKQHLLASERERLAWQIGELERLQAAQGEWEAINAEHQRLAHGQALLEGTRAALAALSAGDDSGGDSGADAMLARALAALAEVERFDAELAAVGAVLRTAQAQMDDAARTLAACLNHREPDPERLAELDARLGQWVALARRFRRSAPELPELLAQWKAELAQLDAAADLEALERAAALAQSTWRAEAERLSHLRHQAAPRLAATVTRAMQGLGMEGGRLEVALLPCEQPQAFGLESVELRVAGHAGSTPRALAKVASGGELSRLALAIATSTGGAPEGGTLIFDEIDAGIGGQVADVVGRLLAQLGRTSQVLAVTHLAQVAACAESHFVVTKARHGAQTLCDVTRIGGEARVVELARMLGGEKRSGMAHAQALLSQRTEAAE